MQKALQILVIGGLILWGFLWYEKTHPLDMIQRVDDATTSARCAKYAQDVEGVQVLGYGDRIKQFLRGCW